MDTRIAKALAAGTVMALPLLTACGTSTGPAGSSAAPAASSVAPSTPAAVSTPSPTPTADPEKETAAVKAASEKFLKAGLTIGYPDTRYSDYTTRLKPLMTSKGFDSIKDATTTKEGDQALKKLDSERARTTPKIKAQKVSSLTADSAEVKFSYQSLVQQKSGDGWKTLKTQSTESVTVRMVKKDDGWLVDDAS